MNLRRTALRSSFTHGLPRWQLPAGVELHEFFQRLRAAGEHFEALPQVLPYLTGVPAHASFARVFKKPEQFEELMELEALLGDHILNLFSHLYRGYTSTPVFRAQTHHLVQNSALLRAAIFKAEHPLTLSIFDARDNRVLQNTLAEGRDLQVGFGIRQTHAAGTYVEGLVGELCKRGGLGLAMQGVAWIFDFEAPVDARDPQHINVHSTANRLDVAEYLVSIVVMDALLRLPRRVPRNLLADLSHKAFVAYKARGPLPSGERLAHEIQVLFSDEPGDAKKKLSIQTFVYEFLLKHINRLNVFNS